MAEFIERADVTDALIDNTSIVGSELEEVVNAICAIPAADVRPVVFCKDCKRYGGRPWENNESGICARTDFGVGEFDFCSYGEKKEEADG